MRQIRQLEGTMRGSFKAFGLRMGNIAKRKGRLGRKTPRKQRFPGDAGFTLLSRRIPQIPGDVCPHGARRLSGIVLFEVEPPPPRQDRTAAWNPT